VTATFFATIAPTLALQDSISALSPESPFNTKAYAAALASGNSQPVALGLNKASEPVCGCIAALAGSRWNRRLEVFSAPRLIDPTTFWNGVAEFCLEHNVCDLDVQTFASLNPEMPELDNRLSYRERSEFIVDLRTAPVIDMCSANHKRSIKKAAKEGYEIRRSASLEDYTTHVQLMQASMSRRSERGENVPTPGVQDFDFAILQHGAGELFQVISNGRTFASILILLSATSGYYHSAGTLPEGMKSGASPFLINEVGALLAGEGYATLNLGGVDPGADGLRRFKSGFGAHEVTLSAARYSMITRAQRIIRDIARSIKNAPARITRTLGR
jgi:hypothetical protein